MEEERRLHDIARETDEEEKEQMRQRIACLQSEQQERAKLVAEMKVSCHDDRDDRDDHDGG